MSIPGIDAIGSSITDALGGTNAFGAANATTGTQPSATGYLTAEATGSSESVFASTLTGAVNNLQGKQNVSNDLAIKAVTGDLDDIHDYTIASSEAKVTLELTAAIRNKAVDAFNEILRMQV